MFNAAEFQAALDAAKQDAERVRNVSREPSARLPRLPAYDAEWTTRYDSKDRLIFVFSVVLDLDGDDFDLRDYPANRRMPPPLTCAGEFPAPRLVSGGLRGQRNRSPPNRHPMIDPRWTLQVRRAACGRWRRSSDGRGSPTERSVITCPTPSFCGVAAGSRNESDSARPPAWAKW